MTQIEKMLQEKNHSGKYGLRINDISLILIFTLIKKNKTYLSLVN